MRTQSDSQKNSAPSLTPPIKPCMPWRVTFVQALPDLKLNVRFVDGTQGIIDLSRYVKSPDAGVFSALADPTVFGQVFVEHGAVTWPGELDLAPDAMYAQIKKSTLRTP
jgi:uncharacterized protein DUF2442